MNLLRSYEWDVNMWKCQHYWLILVSNRQSYLIHNSYTAWVSPETVVNRDKCNAFSFREERSQHHVTRVQGVNEIWWKSILLFHHVWPPKTNKVPSDKVTLFMYRITEQQGLVLRWFILQRFTLMTLVESDQALLTCGASLSQLKHPFST